MDALIMDMPLGPFNPHVPEGRAQEIQVSICTGIRIVIYV